MTPFVRGFIAAWLFTEVLSEDNARDMERGRYHTPADIKPDAIECPADYHFSPDDTGPEIRKIAQHAERVATRCGLIWPAQDTADALYKRGIDVFLISYGAGELNAEQTALMTNNLPAHYWDIGHEVTLTLDSNRAITGAVIDSMFTAQVHLKGY